jgi:hypothetical protein
MNQQHMQFKRPGLFKNREPCNILSFFCSTFGFSASYFAENDQSENQNQIISLIDKTNYFLRNLENSHKNINSDDLTVDLMPKQDKYPYFDIKKIYYIMHPLYNYRMREDSIVTGSSNLEKKFADIFRLVERAYDYLIETNKFEEYKSILLESFCIKIKMVLIKNRYDFVTKLAKRTLKHIRFPEAYEDLKL